MIASSFKTGDLIIYFLVRESHLTDFPQAAAWAEAEPEPAQAYEHGLGFIYVTLSRKAVGLSRSFRLLIFEVWAVSRHRPKWRLVTASATYGSAWQAQVSEPKPAQH